MRLDRLCLQAEADNPRFSYDDEGRLLPRSPLARDALLGSAVTAFAQAELALLTEQVTGPIVWHHVVSLLILPAIALRRRARLGSILVAAVGLVASPLIGPAPVAVPYLALLFLLASLGGSRPCAGGWSGWRPRWCAVSGTVSPPVGPW